MGYLRSHRLATGGGLALTLCLLACGGSGPDPVAIDKDIFLRTSLVKGTGFSGGLYLRAGNNTDGLWTVLDLRLFTTEAISREFPTGDGDKVEKEWGDLEFYSDVSTPVLLAKVSCKKLSAAADNPNSYNCSFTYKSLVDSLVATPEVFNNFVTECAGGEVFVVLKVPTATKGTLAEAGKGFIGNRTFGLDTKNAKPKPLPSNITLAGNVQLSPFQDEVTVDINARVKGSLADSFTANSLWTADSKALPLTQNATRNLDIFEIHLTQRFRDPGFSIDPASNLGYAKAVASLLDQSAVLKCTVLTYNIMEIAAAAGPTSKQIQVKPLPVDVPIGDYPFYNAEGTGRVIVHVDKLAAQGAASLSVSSVSGELPIGFQGRVHTVPPTQVIYDIPIKRQVDKI